MRLWLSENIYRSTWELDHYVSEFETSVSGYYDNSVSCIDSSIISGNINKALRSGFTCSTTRNYTNIVSSDSSSVSVGTWNIAGDDFSSNQWRLK